MSFNKHIQAENEGKCCKLAGVYVKFNYLNLPCVKHIQVGKEGKCCKLAGVYVPFPFVCVSFNLSFKKKQGARVNELTVKYLEENK